MPASRSINDVVNDIGFGMAQVRLIIFGGGIYFIDGVVVTICSTLPSSIATELSLHPYQRALLMSSLLVGKLVGNYSNISSDSILNRRVPILLGYGVSISACVAATCFYSCWLLCICWFLAGFGMGFGCPAWNALATECSPTSKRMLVGGLSHMWFSLGAVTALVVELMYSLHLDFGSSWREFVLYLQLPCAVLFVGALAIGFVDSPYVFMVQGKYQAARKTLEAMRIQNGSPAVSMSFDMDRQPVQAGGLSIMEGARTLFSAKLCLTTLVACLCTFTLNFVGYGIGYSMPIVLPTLSLKVVPAMILICTSSLDILGYGSGIFASNAISRRGMIMIYLVGVIFVNILLCVGLRLLSGTDKSGIGQISVLTSVFLMPLVMAPGWLVVYVYTTEVFPTTCRGFAHGFVLGCGRFGSILAPFTFEHLHILTGMRSSFFFAACLLAVLNAVLVMQVLPETKGCPLEECSEATTSPLKGERLPLRI